MQALSIAWKPGSSRAASAGQMPEWKSSSVCMLSVGCSWRGPPRRAGWRRPSSARSPDRLECSGMAMRRSLSSTAPVARRLGRTVLLLVRLSRSAVGTWSLRPLPARRPRIALLLSFGSCPASGRRRAVRKWSWSRKPLCWTSGRLCADGWRRSSRSRRGSSRRQRNRNASADAPQLDHRSRSVRSGQRPPQSWRSQPLAPPSRLQRSRQGIALFQAF
mmetsp:Transcript_57605/g.132898  ORF Transcript_57605/g.132898 Transcript_57605/m.132898 type:complete len:218 (+) Transcript_57605:1594-2247(+)